MVKEADVHLSVARNPRTPQQTAEVTVYANGTVIRAQERSENLYASIDQVASKISRQLRKYKERHCDHHHSHGHSATPTPSNEAVSDESLIDNSILEKKEALLPDPGVRRKYFSMSPMNIEEARHQLDLIDHDFYLFKEKDITTVQNIVSNDSGDYNSLIDMESSMIFDTCKNLVSPHQISFIKIVSDYFNMNNQSFDSNYIKNLINNSMVKIEKYFINLKLLNNKELSILTIEDNVWLDNISNILSLTVSQKQFIKYKAIGYRIKNLSKCLPNDKIEVPISKLNQKKILKKLSDKISI